MPDMRFSRRWRFIMSLDYDTVQSCRWLRTTWRNYPEYRGQIFWQELLKARTRLYNVLILNTSIRKSLFSNHLLVPYTALSMTIVYEKGNIETKHKKRGIHEKRVNRKPLCWKRAHTKSSKSRLRCLYFVLFNFLSKYNSAGTVIALYSSSF